MQRMQVPPGHNDDPEAEFTRNTHLRRDQLLGAEHRSWAPGRWIAATTVTVALTLGAYAIWALWGSAPAVAAQELPSASQRSTAAQLRQALMNEWACPGMHANWLDTTTVQCLVEKP